MFIRTRTIRVKRGGARNSTKNTRNFTSNGSTAAGAIPTPVSDCNGGGDLELNLLRSNDLYRPDLIEEDDEESDCDNNYVRPTLTSVADNVQPVLHSPLQPIATTAVPSISNLQKLRNNYGAPTLKPSTVDSMHAWLKLTRINTHALQRNRLQSLHHGGQSSRFHHHHHRSNQASFCAVSSFGASSSRSYKIARSRAQDDEASLCPSDLSLDQPSNASVMLQIHEVKLEAASACDFIRKTVEIVEKTVTVTVILGIFVTLPVAMISVGVKFLHECPKEPKIPIYLLVGGCFGLLKLLSILWKQIRSRRYERLDEMAQPDEDAGDVFVSKSSAFTEAILSLFLLIWFFCGNYWVLRLYKPHFKQLLHEPSNWCDKTVYMFAFMQIMICYVIIGIILLIVGVLVLCYKISTCFSE